MNATQNIETAAVETKELGVIGFAWATATCFDADGDIPSPLCRRRCYAASAERFRPNVRAAWARNVESLRDSAPADWQAWIANRAGRRVWRADWLRLAKSGEFLGTLSDVRHWADIVEACEETTFSIPTKSWRSMRLFREVVASGLVALRNAKLLLSIDDSMSAADINQAFELATRHDLRTFFFGLTSHPWRGIDGVRVRPCLKTAAAAKGQKVDRPCRVCGLCYLDRHDGVHIDLGTPHG